MGLEGRGDAAEVEGVGGVGVVGDNWGVGRHRGDGGGDAGSQRGAKKISGEGY